MYRKKTRKVGTLAINGSIALNRSAAPAASKNPLNVKYAVRALPTGSTLLLVLATSVQAFMVFLMGSFTSFATEITMGSMITMALDGDVKVESSMLINMAASSTCRFPFLPDATLVTTNAFKSSKNVVCFRIPPRMNKVNSETTVLLEKPAKASLNDNTPVI